jgi:hypothetical protein
METKLAIITGGVVGDVYVIDGTKPETYESLGGVVIPEGVDVSTGCLYDGTTFTEPPPPPEPTIEEQRAGMKVSRFQARAALHNAGLLDEVQALMDDPATDMLSRLAWQDSETFSRLSTTVLTISASLGYTDTQLDDLFIAAALIEA